MIFTDAERDYLQQRTKRPLLGRLTTLDQHGAPQARPVGFSIGPNDTIDIGGYSMASSQKFRNVRRDPRVSLVVDDIAAVDPWTVRGIEIRGRAEALLGAGSTQHGMSGDIIRIHPERVLSWGLDEPSRMHARDVIPPAAS